MRAGESDKVQLMQRIRVGMTGLAVVLVLILAASALLRSASNEAPVAAIGAPNADTVANMTGIAIANTADPQTTEEPLADLGLAPGTASENLTAAAEPLPPQPADPAAR